MATGKNADDLDPASWLERHGDYLFSFAMKHLRDRAQAEDAVQDTLLAALNARPSEEGDASLRTWLTGILKHKMMDILRRQAKQAAISVGRDGEHDVSVPMEKILFDSRGDWLQPQSGWGEPEQVLEQERFWRAFALCLDRLPPKLAQLFSLRELSGVSTTELCDIFNITSANAWVMLHRSRLVLKECLEATWLAESHRSHI